MGKLTPKKNTQQQKKSKDLHPNSRKVKQLAKKQLHKIKIQQRRSEASNKLKPRMEKFTFFHSCLPEGVNRLGGPEVKVLIDGYFSRFDDEIAKVKEVSKIRGSSTQYAARLDAIKMTLENEQQEYRSANFEIPDLFSTENFKIFREWDLRESYLPKIRTKLVSPGVLGNYP
ncbi:translation machinery-associated protein 16 [Galendromus occidentalis]|uniref:Translation machinery-associated protein 16 n=1 Tax=Galendromus occidentalis TaxID=34638 RepID=A0AAJ6QN88_9ACAR|nr:translation machinery-associated protein 16 [Galendromus occidentalis]